MNVLAPDDPTDEAVQGRRLLRRIVIREKLRVQVRFLEEIARIPACDGLTLYGGAALHGVHLHTRLSDDLDFLAPPELAAAFPALLVARGLTLEERPGLVPAYTRTGTLGAPIGVGVDVCTRPGPERPAEVRPFGFLVGRTVPVRTLPLAEMLAEKLDCVSRRARAVDYVDLWLGLRRGPAILDETFAALRSRRSTLHYDPAAAREHLVSLRDGWDLALEPCLAQVPNYEVIHWDVEGWLRGK